MVFSFLGLSAQEKDTDGDGVIDKDDNCQNIFGSIHNVGCPWPDSDSDGTLDKDDKCPLMFGDKNWKGCPNTDDDGDGIPNFFDSCPELKGTLEEKGCPSLNNFTTLYYDSQKNINFDKLGDVIFAELQLEKLKSNIILLKIYSESDLSTVPCGSSEEDIQISIIQYNIKQQLFWKSNFEKLLKKIPNKIIIPIQTSKNSIFINEEELKNIIPIKKIQKRHGTYLNNKNAFFVFNNKYNNDIIFKDKEDVYNHTDYLNISIYTGKKIWVSVLSSKDAVDKNLYFTNQDNNFEKISQEEYYKIK